jgi:hypothetical protein
MECRSCWRSHGHVIVEAGRIVITAYVEIPLQDCVRRVLIYVFLAGEHSCKGRS